MTTENPFVISGQAVATTSATCVFPDWLLQAIVARAEQAHRSPNDQIMFMLATQNELLKVKLS